MKKILLSIVYVGWGSMCAQSISPEIISSNGAFYSNSAGMISFTEGEPVGEMASSSGNLITQGFEQSDIAVVSVKNYVLTSSSLVIYPNPFSEHTVIWWSNGFENATLTMIDAMGRNVSISSELKGDKIFIQRNKLAPGIYFVSVFQNDQLITKQKLIVVD